jgi:hypothetical protein
MKPSVYEHKRKRNDNDTSPKSKTKKYTYQDINIWTKGGIVMNRIIQYVLHSPD